MQFARNKLFIIVLLISLLAAGFMLAGRHRVESRNRAVEIAVDYTELEALASSTGKPMAEILGELKKAGVTSVAVQELTVSDLLQNGNATFAAPMDKDGWTGLRISPISLAEQTEDYLKAELPVVLWVKEPASTSETRDGSSGMTIAVRATADYIRTLPVGLPPETKLIREQGLNVVARLVNYPGISSRAIDHSLEMLKQHGVRTIIFGGDTVVGFRSLIPEVADAFKTNNLNYGAIEFSKQKGDAKLSNLLEERLIRVHSIPGAELPTLDMPSAIDRYVKAVKERNIRLLYVRMFDTGAADQLGTNLEYITKIRNNIEADGFTFRQAHPLGQPPVSKGLLVLLAAGVAAGTMLLILSVLEIGTAVQAAIFVLGLLFLAAAAAVLGDTGRKLVALLAAMVFPTLAVLYAAQAPTRSTVKGLIGAAWARFIAATFITACGGLLVTALLSSRDFMLHLNQFAGVKLAQAMPLLILAVLFTANMAWMRDTWKAQKEKGETALRSLLSQPLLIWQTLAAFAALVIVALVLARSGNDSGVGISPLELKFRAVLDHVLIVRPRTKEFIFGHPVILTAIGLVLAGRRRWAAPLLVLGAIGQISVLNTFCHIHTPITLSLLRVVMGVVVGSIFGILLLWIIIKFGKITKGAEPK